MRVIVAKPYGRYSVGAVIPDMPTNQAQVLIRRGLVREDKAVAAAPVNRMMTAAPPARQRTA